MTIIDFAYGMTAPAEAVMFFLICDAFFERRRIFVFWQYILGVGILTILINFSNLVFRFELGNAVGMVFAAWVVSLFFYQSSLAKRFIPLFLCVALSGVIEILVLNIINFFFDLTTNETLSIPSYLVLGVITSKSLGLIICYAIRVKRTSRFFSLGKSYWCLFVLLFSSTIVAAFLIFWILYDINNTQYNFIVMLCSIGLFAGNFLALYLYERSARQNQIIREQEQFEQQMESQLKHMDEIILKQEELRRFKHDMVNQLIAIKSYLDNADISGGQQYVESLTDQLQYISQSINTGNNALDAILSTKKSLAESKGIVFNNEIRIQERLPLDPKDLCIIFGNALDNAIEACDRMPENVEKRIDLLLVQDAHALFCVLSNTTPAKKDRTFTTSKADKINHGFGLQNIRDALANYGAEPSIEQEDETFSLSFNIVLQ